MMNSVYKVLTPAGQFDAIFAEDEDIPIEYSGDELAIGFFKDWLFINQISGEHGHLLDSDKLTPADLYGFCQPLNSGIEVIPPFDDFISYTQEDIAMPMDEFDSAIINDEVRNIADMTLDGISGIEKIKLIKEAGSIRENLKTVQSGMEKLKMVKRINEIRKILGALPSAEFKEPSKQFDVYLEELGGDTFDAAKEFYKAELQGKIVKTVIGDVHMRGSSWREMKRGMKSDELKARLVSRVPEILSAGVYDGMTQLNKNRSDRFVAFHFFEKDVSIDGVIVTAGVNVGERDNSEYVYTVYGIGHEGVPNWVKKKATSESDALDAALIRGELFRCPGVPSEPTAKPGSTSSPLLTMDSSLNEGGDEVNIVILRAIDNSTGKRLSELEDNSVLSEELSGQQGTESKDETQGTHSGNEPSEINDPAETTELHEDASPEDDAKSGFISELESLKTETDINRFNERLDEIAARVEQAGLMEALDKELNDTADVLTRLLAEAERN